jgi:serine/threonine protein kinase
MGTPELVAAAAQVEAATDYCALFGDDVSILKQAYRKLARVLHPDAYRDPADKALAERAFRRLQAFYDAATSAEEQETYGVVALVTMRTALGAHEFTRPLGTPGDLSDVYLVTATMNGGAARGAIGKVARAAADNDLLRAEAQALRRLRGADGDPERFAYIPELLDAFDYGEAGRPRRATNVLARLDGFVTLEQVRVAYPRGVSPLDMAWIWRRLLLALGYAHGLGVIHGAALPAHIMIHPDQHGVVLVDWCYASIANGIANGGAQPPIKAIVERYRGYYPEEVFAKHAPSPATDIGMAARCMVALLGGDPLTGKFGETQAPKPIQSFLRGCMAVKQSLRPDDAWALLEEFDGLLERLGDPYFPRRFHPFVLPT